MDTVSLSKADRFFPLIAQIPEDSGGILCLQNILDLKDTGILDSLRGLQREIARIRMQSQLLDDALLQEPLLTTFFRFVDAAHEVADARRVMDSGHFLTVVRENESTISLEPEIFYLSPLKASLQHILERYGRFDWIDTSGKNEGKRTGAERIIAMTKWLIMKNHMFEYLMTFDVSRTPNTREYTIKVPKWDGQRPIPESERQDRYSEVENFLVACCHPGRLGVFPAANIQVHHE